MTPTIDPAFVAAINARFSGEAVLLAQVAAPPEPRNCGPRPLDPAIAAARKTWLARIAAEGRPNEPHALLLDGQVTPQTADYTVVDFATICAIRETGTWPPLLSAGALPVCRERSEVLLQRRSAWVSTYRNCLDIVGGAYQPPGRDESGDPDLRTTIAREFMEETGLVLAPDRESPAVIAGQLRAGFSGYVELGLDIAANDLAETPPSREGRLVPMDAAALATALFDPAENWVPTARLHVLTWLKLGARGYGSGGDLGSVLAPDVADRLLADALA